MIYPHKPLDHILLGIAVFAISFVSLELYWLYSQPIKASTTPYEQVRPTAITPDSNTPKRLQGLDNWERPPGPWHVALQVGHLRAKDAPDELSSIRKNTGTSHGVYTEVAVNQDIATRTKTLLEAEGVIVEVFPTTIPPNHFSDVFVSIHADGNASAGIRGYKSASSWRDYTRKGRTLSAALDASYGEETGIPYDPTITANMRGYYAFNWRRFEHSVHPMTVSAIMETGFLTNAADRALLTQTPEKAARGIANGILRFLKTDAALSRL